MTVETAEGTAGLSEAVRISETICALPAVATQDWCDQAAAALLTMGYASSGLVMIGQVHADGTIVRNEATGVAGSYIAEVTTTLGRPQAAKSIVPIDPRDPGLARLRASLAQARDLGWHPGEVNGLECRVGRPEELGAGTNWPQTAFGRRWENAHPQSVMVGTIGLGGSVANRLLVVEIGLTAKDTTIHDSDLDVLAAVLPALGRRALLAIGSDPTDGAQWLTPREQVILQHLLLGKSVRQIADDLGRSPHTVHDHVKSLHRKLNASSRGELVARALGYVEPKPQVTVTQGARAAV